MQWFLEKCVWKGSEFLVTNEKSNLKYSLQGTKVLVVFGCEVL